VALSDIRLPMFAVATMTDHVSPWRSVHKLHLLPGFELDFVLTTGGHNAGIVSEPGHRNRRYFHARRAADAFYADPERWLEAAAEHEGSWWPQWIGWLERVSTGPPLPARAVPAGLDAAPGRYVLER
jgi:polyhydroxyalkanoate synthase